MKKSTNLLSKKSLLKLLKSHGIRRVSSDVYKECERIFRNEAEILAQQLKEQLLIEGRETLCAKDIKALRKKAIKEDNWEI